MKIDPVWAFGWGIVTTVLAFLAATGLPAFIDPHVSDIVKQSASWLTALTGAVTTYCSAFSSAAAGPMTKKPDGE